MTTTATPAKSIVIEGHRITAKQLIAFNEREATENPLAELVAARIAKAVTRRGRAYGVVSRSYDRAGGTTFEFDVITYERIGQQTLASVVRELETFYLTGADLEWASAVLSEDADDEAEAEAELAGIAAAQGEIAF